MSDDHAGEPTPASELDELLRAGETIRGEEDARSQRAGEFQIIHFSCGGREFAVSIDSVERTERVPMMTSVPRSPEFIRGVASLRGDVVCILDLRSFLGGQSEAVAAEAKSLLVITDGVRRVGVLSESLPDFQRIDSKETVAIPIADLEIYSGAIERDSKLMGIIDTVKLFDLIERRLSHAS